jgi:hypothetical protein
MFTAGSRSAAGQSRGDARDRPLIRRASAWRPSRHPRLARLQELEGSTGIRWVDLNGGALRYSEAQALLNPVCCGELAPRMVRDLLAAGWPAERTYGDGRVSLTPAFRIGRLLENGGWTSAFEPVHLLAGDDWLLSCWLQPRVYHGLGPEVAAPKRTTDELYAAVAETWVVEAGESAADLAESVRRTLAIAVAV